MKPETTPLLEYEIIDSKTLAERWKVTHGWIRKQATAAEDRIPHLKMGRYTRFAWGSPDLCKWLERRYTR